ncbi:hypothetical protein BC827DRAFT_1174583 [Russula dissimulans]|nr:hypothetical protein BC827DRAFT_1174583 [Russula dissimulans]
MAPNLRLPCSTRDRERPRLRLGKVLSRRLPSWSTGSASHQRGILFPTDWIYILAKKCRGEKCFTPERNAHVCHGFTGKCHYRTAHQTHQRRLHSRYRHNPDRMHEHLLCRK